MPSSRGCAEGLAPCLIGEFSAIRSIAAWTNSLISYGIFPVNTLRRVCGLSVSSRLHASCRLSALAVPALPTVPNVPECACHSPVRSNPAFLIIFPLRWVAERSFPFSKALLHGAVGYKVFPINTLAAKREEDLSGNGVAARPCSRRKAPCLLCLCKRK
jgi:hypothetical protein